MSSGSSVVVLGDFSPDFYANSIFNISPPTTYGSEAGFRMEGREGSSCRTEGKFLINDMLLLMVK